MLESFRHILSFVQRRTLLPCARTLTCINVKIDKQNALSKLRRESPSAKTTSHADAFDIGAIPVGWDRCACMPGLVLCRFPSTSSRGQTQTGTLHAHRIPDSTKVSSIPSRFRLHLPFTIPGLSIRDAVLIQGLRRQNLRDNTVRRKRPSLSSARSVPCPRLPWPPLSSPTLLTTSSSLATVSNDLASPHHAAAQAARPNTFLGVDATVLGRSLDRVRTEETSRAPHVGFCDHKHQGGKRTSRIGAIWRIGATRQLQWDRLSPSFRWKRRRHPATGQTHRGPGAAGRRSTPFLPPLADRAQRPFQDSCS